MTEIIIHKHNGVILNMLSLVIKLAKLENNSLHRVTFDSIKDVIIINQRNEQIIKFAMHLTGDDRETIEQMLADYLRFL